MRAAGHPVTIGPAVPPEAQVVVWYPDGADVRATFAKRWQAARHAQVLVRGDRAFTWRPAITPDVTILPSGASAQVLGEGLFIPLLPQRGLIPRREERTGSVSTVVFKGNPENVPDYLTDTAFQDALRTLGFTLRLDVPATTDGEGNRWHDFADVDITMCVRADVPDDDRLRKPATRMVNGWAAGSIPLVAPEPAYLELCTDRRDALVVDGSESILDALRLLREDPALLHRIEAGVREQGRSYGGDAVLRQWEELLLRTHWSRPGPWTVARRRARSMPTVTAQVLAGARGRQLSHRLLSR